MRGFDLLLSYNWGAMDGVMAHRLHRGRSPARLIHHEDGFNEDESVRRNWKRNLFRRHALRHVAGVVVPSALLQQIAADTMKVGARTHQICHGQANAASACGPDCTITDTDSRPGEVVIGTMAGRHQVKDTTRLTRP